jgi:hypothetical protein
MRKFECCRLSQVVIVRSGHIGYGLFRRHMRNAFEADVMCSFSAFQFVTPVFVQPIGN